LLDQHKHKRKRKGTKQQVQAETEHIRKLMEDDGLPDYKIIQLLKIPRRTFYFYKNRIIKDDERLWRNISYTVDSRKRRAMLLLDTLQNCYYINKQIAENPKEDSRTRIEASKTMSIAQRHMYQLINEGPFSVSVYSNQLPNTTTIPAQLPTIATTETLVPNTKYEDEDEEINSNNNNNNNNELVELTNRE
jgi:hypothetical protein